MPPAEFYDHFVIMITLRMIVLLIYRHPKTHLVTSPILVIYRKNAVNLLKDTHKEKAPSNKTPPLTKSRNMGIWVVRTSNQPFKRGS